MKKAFTRLLAVFLCTLMLFQSSEGIIAPVFADPAIDIPLSVPQTLQDGGNYFFIREDFSISEKSTDKLYIPIQRTGDVSAAADITLKLVDMTAHYGVNYTAEIYKAETEPVLELGGVSVVDLFLNGEYEEIEPDEFNDAIGQAVYEEGGADLLSTDGEVIGHLTGFPLDDEGNPVTEESPRADTPEETIAAATEEVIEGSSAQSLRAARNAYTGTTSDRQQLEGPTGFADSLSGANPMSGLDEAVTPSVEDSYPGRDYNLHFDAGEEAKFLVITPLYSDAAEGDSIIMLLLKNLPDGFTAPEDFNMRTVVIQDEDPRTPVTVSFAQAEIKAENGTASITVTREGRVNSVVGVMLQSADGTATAGDDYGGVGAKLYFPMGVTQRTVELPVTHGVTEKDFKVYISPLPDDDGVTIGTSCARVVIAAAEIEAALMEAKDDDRLGDQWNLQNCLDEKSSHVSFRSNGYGVYMETPEDKCCGEYIDLYHSTSYAWDGISVYCKLHTWYSMIQFLIKKWDWDTSSWVNLYDHKYGDCSTRDNQTVEVYYGTEASPNYIKLKDWCYEVHNGFRDSYTDLTIYSVQPIKRKFTVQLQQAQVLHYEGLTDKQILDDYEHVVLDDSFETTGTYWTNGHFSVSRLGSKEWSRFYQLVAVHPTTGATYTLGTNNGNSGSISVDLTESVIDALARRGYITWTKASNGSYSGTIQIRPVFKYVKDVTVQVLDTGYGGVGIKGAPELLWDFNADGAMSKVMGAGSRHNVNWAGEKDAEGNSYYTFTATAADPYVSIDMPYDNASNLVWAAVRAKNLCNADAIELYGKFNNSGPYGSSCVHVDLAHDTQWHTYLINVPEENVRTVNAYKGETITQTTWKGTVNWLRIDPIWYANDTEKSGDKIQIDYVAFFRTKESAEIFLSGTDAAKVFAPGTHTFHYGDKLTFVPVNTPESTAAAMTPVGIGYISRMGSASGWMSGGTDCSYFIKSPDPNKDDSPTFLLEEDYYEFWQVFSDKANAVRLRVPESDLQYLDTGKGIFAGLTQTETSGGYAYYTVKPSVVTNEFIELTALTKDSTHVPLWSLPNNSKTFSGNVFWFYAGVKASDNVVTLRVDRTEADHAYYTFDGTAYTSTLNLTTGQSADDIIPVNGAGIEIPFGGATSTIDGTFTTSAIYLKGGTWMRYLVSYNGQTAVREVKLAEANAPKQEAVFNALQNGKQTKVQAVPMSLGGVQVQSWAVGGARFENVTVKLDGFNCNAISAMEMNGKKLEINVIVNPGSGYLGADKDGNTVTIPENVVDVTLYFQNQLTGEIHGVYSTTSEEDGKKLKWDAETNTATLTIMEFSPESPELYTYGDVLMARLTTDRRPGGFSQETKMVYQSASTGFTVIADQQFEPKTMDLEVNFADFITPEGLQEGSRRSFGQWPWMGEITAVVHTFNVLSSSVSDRGAQEVIKALEDMGKSGLQSDDEAEAELMGFGRQWAVSAAAVVKENNFGGVRVMVGVAFTTGTEGFQKTANPYEAKQTFDFWDEFLSRGVHGYGDPNKAMEKIFKSTFGGGAFTFSLYLGLYVDFGFIANQDTDASGHTEISHDHVLLAAGGFVGGKVTAGYTFAFYTVIPWYINFEAAIDVTVFLGAEADPNKTLDEAYYNSDQVFGNDWGFNVELVGRGGFSGTVGVGAYKIIGVRATATIGVNMGMSNNMGKWYPDLDGTKWISYSTDFTATGTIDYVFGSIELFSASWPLPFNDGWLGWFQQASRAEKLILLANKGINAGRGTAAARAEARKQVDDLAAWLDLYTGGYQDVRQRVNAVQEYCYKNGIITWNEYNMIDMLRMSGVIGGAINQAVLTEDAQDKSLSFHVNDHVNSNWVANDASLMAAFGQVSSHPILENAPASTASKIIALGDNRFLVTFLDDDVTRDRQQAYTLKYTVFDANAETWTEPKAIQLDETADSSANLVDAGDKIIVTWTSIAQEKYDALKAQVADELTAQNGAAATDGLVQDALERDPARLLEKMDVFTVLFDKETCTFGPIEQLTDDDYYDATPQAVYDAETGDYIILYYKTAQDDEEYDTAEDKLNNLLSSNPDEHTYSVLCYMLYNNQTDASDTLGNTHEPGWARDYYFPNETAASPETQAQMLATWKGQRFLNSALRDEDGGQTDMPISDLTVAQGYNGLAAFTFTVDKDFNLETADDRDMFMQFYRFKEHSIYVPIKVAGEEEVDVYDPLTGDVTGTTMEEVGVSDPKLIRADGSTWLFWRQGDDGLRYLNISELLNAKVPVSVAQSGDGEWYYDGETEMTYALRSNGTFAVDATTGKPYQPNVQRVDFGSIMTDDKLNATEYHVITDKDDNIYVVWTDSDVYTEEYTDGIAVNYPTLGIYASAMIKEEDRSGGTEEGEEAGFVAAWSKPYLLTRDNSYNDGLSIALADDGGLIIVHNQLRMLYADTEEKQAMMIDKGLAGVQEIDGRLYFIGSPFYPSDINLTVTTFAPIGSVEATEFRFSDDTPVAGQTVNVVAIVENTGLTAAEGCDITVYECKDGQRGKEVYSIESNGRFPVNTAQQVIFEWTIPADGPEGYTLLAVSREKKADGTYYDPIENASSPFELKPVYELEVDSAVQNGDSFDMKYHVTNTGNLPAPEGYSATLELEALYGDITERYGMDDAVLILEDISGLKPGETRTVEKAVELPVSVFQFCGYDAVSAIVRDERGAAVAATEQTFISLDAPIHLTLNGGKAMSVEVGKQAQVNLSYESTLFMDTSGTVIYTVDDPNIASVDAAGNLTGLMNGTTTLTATLLPSGTSVSITVKVGDGSGPQPDDCPKDDSCPMAKFTDVNVNEWYHDGIHWALDEGVMRGTGADEFSPQTATNRAMLVTMLWRLEGAPEPAKSETSFIDVEAGSWYERAVLWATDTGITLGTSTATFSPYAELTREQLAAFLYRYAAYKGLDVNAGADADLSVYTDANAVSDFARLPMQWAVTVGIIRGTSATVLSPGKSATRAEVATMLMRYCTSVASPE